MKNRVLFGILSLAMLSCMFVGHVSSVKESDKSNGNARGKTVSADRSSISVGKSYNWRKVSIEVRELKKRLRIALHIAGGDPRCIALSKYLDEENGDDLTAQHSGKNPVLYEFVRPEFCRNRIVSYVKRNFPADRRDTIAVLIHAALMNMTVSETLNMLTENDC